MIQQRLSPQRKPEQQSYTSGSKPPRTQLGSISNLQASSNSQHQQQQQQQQQQDDKKVSFLEERGGRNLNNSSFLRSGSGKKMLDSKEMNYSCVSRNVQSQLDELKSQMQNNISSKENQVSINDKINMMRQRFQPPPRK